MTVVVEVLVGMFAEMELNGFVGVEHICCGRNSEFAGLWQSIVMYCPERLPLVIHHCIQSLMEELSLRLELRMLC